MILRRDRAITAILIMLDVAFYAGRSGTVSAADIAERSSLARRGIEPLLQSLSRTGLLESIRGPRGGYRLGRPRRDISLVDIIAAVTQDEPGHEDGPQGPLFAKIIDPTWKQLDKEVTAQMKKTSLDDLVKKTESAGLKRPLNEPITFSI